MADELRKLMEDVDIKMVFAEWQKHQPNPDRVKLTPPRAVAIRARLRDGHSVEELVLLVGDYAYKADTNEARWWRGDNPEGKEYLDIINLLRASKTAGRVERALAWKHASSGRVLRRGRDAPSGDVEDVNLGPMAAFREGRVLRHRG